MKMKMNINTEARNLNVKLPRDFYFSVVAILCYFAILVVLL
mgnify:CR=1 FL=1